MTFAAAPRLKPTKQSLTWSKTVAHQSGTPSRLDPPKFKCSPSSASCGGAVVLSAVGDRIRIEIAACTHKNIVLRTHQYRQNNVGCVSQVLERNDCIAPIHFAFALSPPFNPLTCDSSTIHLRRPIRNLWRHRISLLSIPFRPSSHTLTVGILGDLV